MAFWFTKKPPLNETDVSKWTWKQWFTNIWNMLYGMNFVYYRLGTAGADPTTGSELSNEFMAIDYNGNKTFILPPSKNWAHKPYCVYNDVTDAFTPKVTNVTITSGSGDVIREGRWTGSTVNDVFGRGDSIEFRSDGNGTWFVTNHHSALSLVTGYLNADVAVAAAVALPGAIIPFATEVIDRYGENNAGTYTFTCGHPGIYDIYLHLEAEQTAGAATSALYGMINVNGTNVAIDVNNNGGRNRDAAFPFTVQLRHVLNLAYGDTVSFYYAWTGAGAAGTLNGGTNPKYSWFSIQRWQV